MARLNTRPSTAAPSPTQSPSPSLDRASDEENRDPAGRHSSKRRQHLSDSAPRQTPSRSMAEESESVRSHKRKRAMAHDARTDQEEEKFNRYFDPNQDPDVRRDVKRRSRALERQFQENRDEYLRSNGGEALINTIDDANSVFKQVKQTNDATLDSRLLVNISDLAYKKTARLVLGDTSSGVDVELFLSKCIAFMRNGGHADELAPGASQRRANRIRHAAEADSDDDDDEDEDSGEALDWEFLGQHACFPYNLRPAAPSFLLGPLSVEKKQRTQTQRRARNARDTAGREARPDQLTREDLSQSDENQLTAICTRINDHLKSHCQNGAHALERAGVTSLDSDEAKELLRKHRLTETGGPSLFDYVINPTSFGQTVENLFYVSFLIKEGVVGIEPDENGLPTLAPATSRDIETHRRENISKHQAILSLDYSTWQDLTKAFDIREPMIPHRNDDQPTQIGERGWYS